MRRGLCTEGNLRLKVYWASYSWKEIYPAFALFYAVLEGNFQVQAPEGLHSEGRLNGGIFALRVWGAYIWRGVFSEFYGISQKSRN